MKDSSLCGYLHIRGLTDEYPELTTFFDAEIIGNAYSFVTKKWDASSKTDKEHWVSVCKAGVSRVDGDMFIYKKQWLEAAPFYYSLVKNED